jgi:2-dehydro-3-deoxyglucarate aldolase
MERANIKKAFLKNKLKNNQLTIGSWITLADTAVAEIMAQSGFDWLTVDMEHSVITLDKAQELIRVIEFCSVVPLVRVGENNPNLIKRVMDAGAHGVIVPMVNTKEDAINAVSATKYPPLGKRGVGLARAQGYGLEFHRYKNWVNRESIVIVQIEHIVAINNLEHILSVDGVDGFIVGPYDLSASLGVPGDFEHTKVKAALKKILDLSQKIYKPAGFHVIPPDAEVLLEKVRQGYKFLGFSLDTLFLGRYCRDQIIKIKKKIKEKL